jgi:flagellar hook assembly protein FlgD
MSVSPNPFSPDGDGREDFAVVQFHLPLQVSVVRLRIYDVRGRLIRTLANNEPAGPNGEVTWDGTDDARRRARIGIYILLLEAIDDLGGVVETAKGTVVLAGRL